MGIRICFHHKNADSLNATSWQELVSPTDVRVLVGQNMVLGTAFQNQFHHGLPHYRRPCPLGFERFRRKYPCQPSSFLRVHRRIRTWIPGYRSRKSINHDIFHIVLSLVICIDVWRQSSSLLVARFPTQRHFRPNHRQFFFCCPHCHSMIFVER